MVTFVNSLSNGENKQYFTNIILLNLVFNLLVKSIKYFSESEFYGFLIF